jgi:hypothetical protein
MRPVDFDSVLEERFGIGALKQMAERSHRRMRELAASSTEAIRRPRVVERSEPVELPDRGFARALARSTVSPVAEPAPAGDGLDAWQSTALESLLSGSNLVVDAPTSAGKTRVVERLIDAKIDKGLRLIYTSPVKSLSNDKYREFSERYGRERVGINTGDFKENLGAPIILATLETYRNSLLGVEPRMDRMIVVYDEYHYLQDEGRGSAWEESIILSPVDSQLVLLSASVPNAQEFADWITDLKGKRCHVVRVSERPVPLVDAFHTKHGWILGDEIKIGDGERRRLLEMSRVAREQEKRGARRNPRDRYLPMVAPVEQALAMGLGPLVVYAGRRADVENIAFTLGRGIHMPMEAEERKRLDARLTDLPGWEFVPAELRRLIQKTGMAYHHSGLVPPGRVAIETLLKEGFLRICSGTMGISLGVNFAVRSAIVADESRPGEGGETRYSGTEVMQMLGRAGRRGRDTQGFSLWVNPARFALQKPNGREPCRSSLKFDPTTVLGILGQRESLAYLSAFYKKSFFMRGRSEDEVLVRDHDLLSGILYRNHPDTTIACENIPENYSAFCSGKKRQTECPRCTARDRCHSLALRAGKSPLEAVVAHLTALGALEGATPTYYGQLARYFPQAGGLIFAKWIAAGELTHRNLRRYVQAFACFCAAQHKEIPMRYADFDFIEGLNLAALVEEHYPARLFPELYDEQHYGGEVVFREFHMGAASIAAMWLDDSTRWEELVREHESKGFSAGDCMMVLFRLSTLLQSCLRLREEDARLAAEAERLRDILLRDPLDARNRILLEADSDQSEDGEESEGETPDDEDESEESGFEEGQEEGDDES